MIEVSFEMTGFPYQLTPVANHSISISRQFSARQCWSVFVCISDSVQASCRRLEIWHIILKYQRGYFCVTTAVKLLVHFEKWTFKFN